MSMESLLLQRAAVERAETSVNDAGDATTTWSVAAESVPCLVEILDAQATATGAGLTPAGRARAYFLADADVRSGAGESVGDRIVVEGARYRVLSVAPLAGPRGRLQVATLAPVGSA